MVSQCGSKKTQSCIGQTQFLGQSENKLIFARLICSSKLEHDAIARVATLIMMYMLITIINIKNTFLFY